MEAARLDRLGLLILIYFGCNFDLVAVFVVLHHSKQTHHECTEEPSNVGKCIVILLEIAGDKERKTRLAYKKLDVLSGIRDDGRSKDISLCRLVDYASSLGIEINPGP